MSDLREFYPYIAFFLALLFLLGGVWFSLDAARVYARIEEDFRVRNCSAYLRLDNVVCVGFRASNFTVLEEDVVN